MTKKPPGKHKFLTRKHGQFDRGLTDKKVQNSVMKKPPGACENQGNIPKIETNTGDPIGSAGKDREIHCVSPSQTKFFDAEIFLRKCGTKIIRPGILRPDDFRYSHTPPHKHGDFRTSYCGCRTTTGRHEDATGMSK